MGGGRALLVDAHNVLHADPALRRLLGSAETARRALERRLRGRRDCWLFYDGGPGGVADERLRDGLHIDYAGAGEADDRLIAWLRARPGVAAEVVSDDRGLRARARTLGARVVDVADFLASLPDEPSSGAIKPDVPDDAELRMWLREFGAE